MRRDGGEIRRGGGEGEEEKIRCSCGKIQDRCDRRENKSSGGTVADGRRR